MGLRLLQIFLKREVNIRVEVVKTAERERTLSKRTKNHKRHSKT